jgi:hypothetical protein
MEISGSALCPDGVPSMCLMRFRHVMCIAHVMLYRGVSGTPLASALGEPLADGLCDRLGDPAKMEQKCIQ